MKARNSAKFSSVIWSVGAPLKEDISHYSSMDYNVVHYYNYGVPSVSKIILYIYYRMHWYVLVIVLAASVWREITVW